MRDFDISVIIPTFNRAQEIVKLLFALATGAVGNIRFEVIVIDDGGTDNTEEAIEVFKKKSSPAFEVRYLKKENGGPAAARNFGAEKARADYIAFIDSDVIPDPEWLEKGFKKLSSHQSAFGVEGATLPLGDTTITPFTEQVSNLTGGRFLTCNLFLRKTQFLKLKGFDERFKRPIREDTEFALRALTKGCDFIFEPSCVVRHPTRDCDASRYYFHAREGMYEALVERKHTHLYRKHTKWFDGRAVPVYYMAHYLSLLAAPFSLSLSGILLGFGMTAVLYSWIRKTNWKPDDILKLFFPSLTIPYIRIYYVILGYFKYPGSPE